MGIVSKLCLGIAVIGGSLWANDFIHASGDKLMKDNKVIRLRGVAFANDYETSLPNLLTSKHHNEYDYKNVAGMGMNCIRFAINGNWYYNLEDKGRESEFWTWLDRNLQWAKQNNIYLILDMHLACGDDWLSQQGENTSGKEFLWTNQTTMNEQIALWEKIALRYKDHPNVAGYDIINEPVTFDKGLSSGDPELGKEWTRSGTGLAQKLINAIRRYDKGTNNHMIIVEPLYGVMSEYELSYLDEDNRYKLYPDVTDPYNNLMYDFHFYEPYKYTHQGATWSTNVGFDEGSYPDENYLVALNYDYWKIHKKDAVTSMGATTLSNWTSYTGPATSFDNLSFTNEGLVIGIPTFIVTGNFRGEVSIDRVTIEEKKSGGTWKAVFTDNLTSETVYNWSFWAPFSNYSAAAVQYTGGTPSGSYDGSHLTIKGTSNYTSEGAFENLAAAFAINKGSEYRVKAYFKGTKGSSTTVPVEVKLAAHEDTKGAHFAYRNKRFIEAQVQEKINLAPKNVPLSVTEFGVMTNVVDPNTNKAGGCLLPGKGGVKWVRDVIKTLDEKGVNCFTFWAYHNYSMGIYLNEDKLPKDCKVTNKGSDYPRGQYIPELKAELTRSVTGNSIVPANSVLLRN